MTTTNTQGAAILCEHEDGRYAVNPDTTGDPEWHRLGPVDISALAASAQSGLTDAYAGAREDLSIWKRRALEAERDLRSEKQTTSRLVGELNAANGPAYMGEPAASPAYGATEYGWADYRRLQDGDKRLIALVVGLYGNDHQSSSDLEGLLDRAYRGQVPAQADSVPPPAEATNTKTHELLSTTVGLLMGYREGAARQPYKPGSVIAKVVYEVVDHLKDWPYPEPTPPAQAADSVLEDAARLDWLDQQCEGYGFQDIHEGNRWEISGPYANVRQAIDYERAARKQGGPA